MAGRYARSPWLEPADGREAPVPDLDVEVRAAGDGRAERLDVPAEGNRLMSDTYDYPAEVERDEDGRHVVTFPDFGWGATDGATRDEALAEARDLLRELIAATMREGKGLPATVACHQAAAPRRAAGADRAEGGALRSVP